MNDEQVASLLRQAKTVAVVGLSDKPWRASHGVSRYLQGAGFRIIPINPNVEEVLGERAYDDLSDLPQKVDVVDVFRKREHVPELVEGAIASGAKLFWMQEGVRNQAAADQLREAGLGVVQDRCLMVEHMRFERE